MPGTAHSQPRAARLLSSAPRLREPPPRRRRHRALSRRQRTAAPSRRRRAYPPRPTQRQRGALPLPLAPPPLRPLATAVAPLSLDLPSVGGGGAARGGAGTKWRSREGRLVGWRRMRGGAEGRPTGASHAFSTMHGLSRRHPPSRLYPLQDVEVLYLDLGCLPYLPISR
jgi:hypothetical protein